MGQAEDTAQTIALDADLLREQVARVAEARRQQKALAAELAVAQERFDGEFAELLREMRLAKQRADLAETQLRESVVSVYTDTGDTKPGPGCSIRMVTELDYNPEHAFAWAVQTGQALQLDRKGFEKIAPVVKPAFVKITKRPMASIATDLDAALVADATPGTV